MEKDISKLLAAELAKSAPNIDLHDLMPSDVEAYIDQFLYKHYNASDTDSVRIIYGIGKGIMKKAVLELVKKYPLISSIKEESGSCIVLFDKD